MDDLFGSAPAFEVMPMADADVRFWRHFYSAAQAAELMARLQQETPWRHDAITLFGKQILQPRLCAWYANPGMRYAYSGLTLLPQPWSPTLAQIRQDLEAACGQRFNSVLLNLYRDQRDSMGWHSDDEAELGRDPVIASLSLGATRRFKFRRRDAAQRRSTGIELTDGSLLLMAGSTQHYWQHAIDKEAALCGPRINLTFRTIYRDL